jgi:hypothetical protein
VAGCKRCQDLRHGDEFTGAWAAGGLAATPGWRPIAEVGVLASAVAEQLEHTVAQLALVNRLVRPLDRS